MSFDTAVSGIKASSTSLEIIGSNIANAGTTGYKSSRGEFSDVFASSLTGTGANSVGKGVAVAGISQAFSQGNVSFTSNVMDMAINGGGFFVLSDGGSNVYSRAGNFQTDRSGFVVNPEGLRLQVFATAADGTLSGGIQDLQIDSSLIQPQASNRVDLSANLDSRDTAPTVAWPVGGFDAFAVPPTAPSSDMFNASTAVTIYDSLGNPHTQSFYFVKTATPNEWDVHTMIDGVSVAGPDTVTFDSSGQIPTASLPFQVSIAAWTPLDSTGVSVGANTEAITIDMSNLSQFGNDFAVTNIEQDGFTTGQLSGIEVGDSGIVFGRFSNGQSRALGQIALATFSNVSGLQPQGGSVWSESFDSGPGVLTAPGTSGTGAVVSGALEDSNVDISQELVNMIVAQRNFQANAKMIQTEDTITQAIINLR